MQQRQQQHRLQTTWRQYRTGGVPTDKGKAVQAQGEQEEKPGQQLDKDSIWTLPNMLSVGRAVSGPFIAYIILQENYSLALWATVISGVGPHVCEFRNLFTRDGVHGWGCRHLRGGRVRGCACVMV